MSRGSLDVTLAYHIQDRQGAAVIRSNRIGSLSPSNFHGAKQSPHGGNLLCLCKATVKRAPAQSTSETNQPSVIPA